MILSLYSVNNIILETCHYSSLYSNCGLNNIVIYLLTGLQAKGITEIGIYNLDCIYLALMLQHKHM